MFSTAHKVTLSLWERACPANGLQSSPGNLRPCRVSSGTRPSPSRPALTRGHGHLKERPCVAMFSTAHKVTLCLWERACPANGLQSSPGDLRPCRVSSGTRPSPSRPALTRGHGHLKERPCVAMFSAAHKVTLSLWERACPANGLQSSPGNLRPCRVSSGTRPSPSRPALTRGHGHLKERPCVAMFSTAHKVTLSLWERACPANGLQSSPGNLRPC